MGRGEAEVLRAALAAGIGYVGLVASRRRGDGVLGALDLTNEERARIRTPAGLDIGARTPEEVALSILAEIVAARPRSRSGLGSPDADADVIAVAVSTAVDPVCGMTVVVAEATLHHDHDGTRYFFCGSGCLAAFVAGPGAYLGR